VSYSLEFSEAVSGTLEDLGLSTIRGTTRYGRQRPGETGSLLFPGNSSRSLVILYFAKKDNSLLDEPTEVACFSPALIKRGAWV
jgi:hypothetical protein